MKYVSMGVLLMFTSALCFGGEAKVVLITGGTKGIGLAAAQCLAAQNYTVYAASRSIDPELVEANRDIHFSILDVTQDGSVKECVDSIICREGKIDVLVNNAGYGLAGPVECLTIDEIEAQFNVNYLGVVRMCQAVLPYMRKQNSGHIINVSSFQGVWGLPHASAYSSSKAAVEMLSEALYVEVLPWNIHISLVEPGFTPTQFVTKMGTKKADGYENVLEIFKELDAQKKQDIEMLGPYQTAEEVGLFLLEVIEDEEPKLRYQTSKHAEEMARLKLKTDAEEDYLNFIIPRNQEMGLLPCLEKMVKVNGIELWCETFGKRSDPALLLIVGGCCQGILWPREFCAMLVDRGYFVIRYDHRDAGRSTSVDYEKSPYDLLDMAKDAMGLLDALHIGSVHLVGHSMGGPIAELMAVYFPERVTSITLIATSSEFRPMNLAVAGLPAESGFLSSPQPHYIELMKAFLQNPPTTGEEKLEERLAIWRLLSGSKVPFEEKRYKELQIEFLNRQRHFETLANHMRANRNSEQLVRSIPAKVNVPALIFAGSEDPLFGKDHGESLARQIQGSTYFYLQGMGHVLNCHFYEKICDELVLFTERLRKA